MTVVVLEIMLDILTSCLSQKKGVEPLSLKWSSTKSLPYVLYWVRCTVLLC